MNVAKGPTVASLLATAIIVGACQDRRPEPLDPQLQAAKVCPPGQIGKGCTEEPPPPPPGDPQLPGIVIGEMISPLRIDHTPHDWLLVTDSRLRMVLRIDPATLQPTHGFTTQGKPLGVTALGMSIFVGNVSDGTIDVYSADGGALSASFGPGAVSYPADLAADDAQGWIFALDGRRREVRVFDASGSLLHTISGPGSLDDQLMAPTAMGLDPVRQWVLVSDYGGEAGPASLKIFSYDGTFVHRVSGQGSCGMLGCSGGFSRPQGAAVDAAGRVYLPDSLLGEVWIYDPATWTVTNRLGIGGMFSVPTDVVLDGFGDLFVTANWSAEIEVVRGVGQP